jgi:hypothetical protein
VKRSSAGTRICLAKVGGALTRSRSTRCAVRRCSGTAASSPSAAPTCARYSLPVAVSESDFGPRVNSGAPSNSSSAAMRLPIALAVTLSSSAARSKLPRRAAASKALRPSIDGNRMSGDAMGRLSQAARSAARGGGLSFGGASARS